MRSFASFSTIASLLLLFSALSAAPARAQCPEANPLPEPGQVLPPEYYYEFGRFLEPPVGYVLHGIGNDKPDQEAYVAAIEALPGDEATFPAFAQEFVNVGYSDHGETDVESVTEVLEYLHAQGRIPMLCISYYDYRDDGDEVTETVDHLIPSASENFELIDQIEAIGEAIRLYQEEGYEEDEFRPVFCRIGTEFNNEFGSIESYHQIEFPKCYRRTVDILRAEEACCAYIWCWFAGAPTDYLATVHGEYKWYPGDDYVDWFGLDFYKRNEFSTEPAVPCNGFTAEGHLDEVEEFLAAAEAHRCPVFVETSCVDINVEAGSAAIAEYFDPMLNFIETHPIIKALDYVSRDWTGEPYQCWGNGTVSDNQAVFQYWAGNVLSPTTQFLGIDCVNTLNGFKGWCTLRKSLSGANGPPRLSGGRVVAAAQKVQLNLVGGGSAGANAVLYVSTGKQDAPFYGGILVPGRTTSQFYFVTSHGGTVNLPPFTWSAGAFPLYFQFWIQDPSAPQGWSASNALKGQSL